MGNHLVVIFAFLDVSFAVNSCLNRSFFTFIKGVFIATQLNSTDPVEQRTAKSVVFLFITS